MDIAWVDLRGSHISEGSFINGSDLVCICILFIYTEGVLGMAMGIGSLFFYTCRSLTEQGKDLDDAAVHCPRDPVTGKERRFWESLAGMAFPKFAHFSFRFLGAIATEEGMLSQRFFWIGIAHFAPWSLAYFLSGITAMEDKESFGVWLLRVFSLLHLMYGLHVRVLASGYIQGIARVIQHVRLCLSRIGSVSCMVTWSSVFVPY